MRPLWPKHFARGAGILLVTQIPSTCNVHSSVALSLYYFVPVVDALTLHVPYRFLAGKSGTRSGHVRHCEAYYGHESVYAQGSGAHAARA